MTNLSLFDCDTGARWSEPLGPGACLLHGFALADETALLEAITTIASDSPFRNMVTPGGFVMSVAMTNCGALGWTWVRNPWFRYLHLGAIAFVAAEALLGVMCPLTVWADTLRGNVPAESFVGRWVQQLLYYRAPEWVFTTAYVAWTLATLLTLWLVPPRRRAA